MYNTILTNNNFQCILSERDPTNECWEKTLRTGHRIRISINFQDWKDIEHPNAYIALLSISPDWEDEHFEDAYDSIIDAMIASHNLEMELLSI